jgi:hypothetical protein
LPEVIVPPEFTTHEPLIKRQPPVIVIPLDEESPAVERAVRVDVPVERRRVVEAAPVPRVISCAVRNFVSSPCERIPPAKVEVAVEVEVRAPTVNEGTPFQ